MPIDSQEPSPDRESRSPLDPSPEWIRELGREVVEFAANYYGSLRDIAVYPRTSSAELRSRLAERDPHVLGQWLLERGRARDLVVADIRGARQRIDRC